MEKLALTWHRHGHPDSLSDGEVGCGGVVAVFCGHLCHIASHNTQLLVKLIMMLKSNTIRHHIFYILVQMCFPSRMRIAFLNRAPVSTSHWLGL